MIDGSCTMVRRKRRASRVLMEIVPGGSPQRMNNASGKRFRVCVDCKSVCIGFCPVRIQSLSNSVYCCQGSTEFTAFAVHEKRLARDFPEGLQEDAR